jgi:hypothetical protein
MILTVGLSPAMSIQWTRIHLIKKTSKKKKKQQMEGIEVSNPRRSTSAV